MYRVLIVEDTALEKSALSSAISQLEGYKIIDTVENSESAEILCLRVPYDLIIMDIWTQGGSSGLKSADAIKKNNPKIKIIIATSMADFTFIKKAREAGCESFWYKENADELVDIIHRTMAGESVYPDISPVVKIGEVYSNELTQRELEVIKKLADGKSYQEIADELFVSLDTVRQHIKSIYSKTGFHSNVLLIAVCVARKLVLPGY